MASREDGRYRGTITTAHVAEDQWEPGQYVLKLSVDLPDGDEVQCRQALKDDTTDRRRKRDQVLKVLGLTMPLRSAALAVLIGSEIEVNLKTSEKGNQNAYIATMREERVLTDAELDAMIDDNGMPF